MIYILSGNDNKKKNIYLKKLCKNDSPTPVTELNLTKEMLFDYAFSKSLFNNNQIFVFENILKGGNIVLSSKDLSLLKDSHTIFVFFEEKLPVSEIKKYEKYTVIENFNTQIIKQTPKINIFNIADNFSRKDKINTWISYREAISLGVSPEEISGIIFWKIKTMLLSGATLFSIDELKRKSSELVAIYHKAHRGECDFTISLEQFILSSLSKS